MNLTRLPLIRIRLLLPVFALCALAVGIAAQAAAQPASHEKTHVDEQIASLQTELARAPDPDERANLGAKIAELEKQRSAELQAKAAETVPGFAAAAAVKRATILNEAALADATPLAHLPWIKAGDGFIVEGTDPFEKRSEFVLGNDWFREVSPGVYLVVWAGADGADQTKGVIRVRVEGSRDSGLKRVLETQGGLLRVEGATGSVLTLSAASGQSYRFNAETLELVK